MGIGKDNAGHPTLTGAEPARIGGELIRINKESFILNGISGRHSKHYKNSNYFVSNALYRFSELFPDFKDKIVVEIPIKKSALSQIT